MKTLTSLLPLLLFAFACGSSTESAPQEALASDSLELGSPSAIGQEAQYPQQITGILQSSGLQPQEAQALGLGPVVYQLLAQQAYFVEGHDSLKAYLGQCLNLAGDFKAWEKVEDKQEQQFTYGRKLFVVEKILPLMYGRCHFTDTLQQVPQGRAVVYSGTVARMQRPAPDIAYDYQIKLQEPYRDPNHPIEPGKLVKTLPLFTGNFELLHKLEAAVRQNTPLQLKGVQQQGYAEQEVVWVTAADGLRVQ